MNMETGDEVATPDGRIGKVKEINGRVATVEIRKVVETVETIYLAVPEEEPSGDQSGAV
jgi:hypothetical protein